MNNQVQNQQSTNDKPVSYEVNGKEIRLTPNMIRQYLVNGNGTVTDQEVIMFMKLCEHQKLDPFLNEAYLIKFGNNAAQIIVSKEAFMKRAENNKAFKGFDAGVIVMRDNEIKEIEGAIKLPNDVLIGAYANVYRADRERPVSVKISLDEFGKGQATWKQMPLNMIRKTAIVNALREAFPNSLGAMYTEDDTDINQMREVGEVPTEQTVQNEVNEKQATQKLDFDNSKEEVKVNKTEDEAADYVNAVFNEVPENESIKKEIEHEDAPF